MSKKVKQEVKTRAVIYARFSPRRNAEDCESVEMQIEICKTYCKKKGYEVKSVHFDKALSGDDENRPGLWAAVDDLGRGDVLVAYRLDRLARSVYISYIIEKAVKKRFATLESTAGEGTWSGTDEDWLVRKILQTLAEYEKKVIAARTQAAMLRHQSNGKKMGSRLPYGYMADPDNGAMMVECPFEQEVIGMILEMRKQGKGLREICRCLYDEGRMPRFKVVRDEKTGELTFEQSKWSHVLIMKILERYDVPEPEKEGDA